MKYNHCYQQLIDGDADPNPMTEVGTKAITERYYALKRMSQPKSIVNGFSEYDNSLAHGEIFSIL